MAKHNKITKMLIKKYLSCTKTLIHINVLIILDILI